MNPPSPLPLAFPVPALPALAALAATKGRR